MITEPTVAVEQLEVFADRLDVRQAAEIYNEHGCLVVRGLMKPYLAELQRDIEATAAQSIALLDQAKKVPEGWTTPDGTLFLPAPPGYPRDKQIMVLAISYHTSAAFFRSAFDPKRCRHRRGDPGAERRAVHQRPVPLQGAGRRPSEAPAPGCLLLRAPLRRAGRGAQLRGRYGPGQRRAARGPRLAPDGHAAARRHLLAPGPGRGRVAVGARAADHRPGGRRDLLPRPLHPRLEGEPLGRSRARCSSTATAARTTT